MTCFQAIILIIIIFPAIIFFNISNYWSEIVNLTQFSIQNIISLLEGNLNTIINAPKKNPPQFDWYLRPRQISYNHPTKFKRHYLFNTWLVTHSPAVVNQHHKYTRIFSSIRKHLFIKHVINHIHHKKRRRRIITYMSTHYHVLHQTA